MYIHSERIVDEDVLLHAHCLCNTSGPSDNLPASETYANRNGFFKFKFSRPQMIILRYSVIVKSHKYQH